MFSTIRNRILLNMYAKYRENITAMSANDVIAISCSELDSLEDFFQALENLLAEKLITRVNTVHIQLFLSSKGIEEGRNIKVL